MTGVRLAAGLVMGATVAYWHPRLVLAVMAAGLVGIVAVIWALGRTGLSDGRDE